MKNWKLAGVILVLSLCGYFWTKQRRDIQVTKPFAVVARNSVHSFSDISCGETYMKLYSKTTLDVRMIFGYKDARPARFVDDRYEEMIFVQRLTSACVDDRLDCGFAQARSGLSASEVFIKSLTGPDGEERTVRLTVMHSSVSPDDEDNRKNPFQKWQSDYARTAFTEALRSADVIFYNGHSRSGGGPDFFPPIIDAHGHVKYSQYKQSALSLFAMEKAIRASSKKNLQLLGLFSCASEQLFTRRLERAKPGLGMISSPQLLYFSDALENSLRSLSAILTMKCRPDWGGLFETKTDLKGFWLNPVSQPPSRTKGRDPKYLRRDQ